MSNLVSPMLTSVENSPTSDYYPSSLRFSNSPCAIVNNGNDQICLNDTAEWDDLEHLVSRSNLFTTPTPNKYNIAYNRRIFTNTNSLSYGKSKIQDSKQLINENSQNSELSTLPFNRFEEPNMVINNLWNVCNNEKNSSSKAGVNVNMGYNEGSSLESMISNEITKSKIDAFISNNNEENTNTKQIEATVYQVTDTNTNQLCLSTALSATKDCYQDKTFKNGTKTGHSRQWGSCGSARTLQLSFDDTNIKTKLSLQLKPLNVTKSPNIITTSPTTTPITVTPTNTATERRNTPSNQSNRQNRISQLSFEAEFDSDGRIHEQFTIEFIEFDPFIIASQITQIELSYFRAIKSEEFLSFNWTGLSKHTHAPGIVASTRWFNQLNLWAQRVILDCQELDRRSDMLTYFIRIIKKLVDGFNNLSSGMALMCALEMECIHRLKQTWNILQNKERATFRRMQELFSSTNNYEKLRQHIDSLKLPCIPYLGLYLTDLVYINVAHSKLSEFESQTKTDQINNILRTVSEFQQSEYDIEPIPILYRYLENQRYIEELQKIIEDNNYKSSLALEPNISDSSSHPTNQQQGLTNFTVLSPQKTPPSYACKHVPTVPSLQSPISPKLMSLSSQDESIKELSELQGDAQLIPIIECQNIVDGSIQEEYGASKLQPIVSCECVTIPDHLESHKTQGYDESLMTSSRYSDEDSVRVSLLCGAGRKSQFQKRSNSTSIRFKRDSSSSSRQQVYSKTATLSSTSQSLVSDKDVLGLHSKSLLDDSFLDATLTEPRSGPSSIISVGQVSVLSDLRVAPRKPQTDILCSPPMCICFIRKEEVSLKPQSNVQFTPLSSSTLKSEYSVFQNIARAAELAAKFSTNYNCYQPTDLDYSPGINVEISPDDQDILNLICQGLLSRKAYLIDGKRSRFAMWARYWSVLIMSKNNAYLVLFENSHFRALDRKDFKYKQCHVQDLRKILVSCTRPPQDSILSEQKISSLNENSNEIDHSHYNSNLKKFFLIDKQYRTVYKFRDSSSRSRSVPKDRKVINATSTTIANEKERCLPELSSGIEMPSAVTWYRLLKRSIRDVNFPATDNKDLIVLGDN